MYIFADTSDKMERLSEWSKLNIAKDTTAHKVPETSVAFRDNYRVIVNPTTPADCQKTNFSFQIHPVLPSEIDLQECNLNVTFKITKNGQAYSANDQISCVQALGVLAWESVKISIAGKEIFSDFQQENHAQYIKMETSYSDYQKVNMLNQVGYRMGKLGDE